MSDKRAMILIVVGALLCATIGLIGFLHYLGVV